MTITRDLANNVHRTPLQAAMVAALVFLTSACQAGTADEGSTVENQVASATVSISGATDANATRTTQVGANAALLQPLNPGALYRISSAATGLAADISQASQVDGAPLIEYSENAGTNQQWILQGLGHSQYNIISGNSGKCLDAADHGAVVGANLAQWTCAGNTLSQVWHFESTSTLGYKIINTNTGVCVEAGGTASIAGPIYLNNCDNSDAQLWQFNLLGGTAAPANYVAARSASEVLTIAGSQLLGDIEGDTANPTTLARDATLAWRHDITIGGRQGRQNAADTNAFVLEVQSQIEQYVEGGTSQAQTNYKAHLTDLTAALAQINAPVSVPALVADRGGGFVAAASHDTSHALFAHDATGRIVVHNNAMQQHYGWDDSVIGALNTIASTTPDLFVQHIRFAGIDSNQADTYEVDLFIDNAWKTLTVDGAQGSSSTGVATAWNEIWGRIIEKAILSAEGSGYNYASKAGDAAAWMTMITGQAATYGATSPANVAAALDSFVAGGGAVLETRAAPAWYNGTSGASANQLAPAAGSIWCAGSTSYAIIGVSGTAPNRQVELENPWNDASKPDLGEFTVAESALPGIFPNVAWITH